LLAADVATSLPQLCLQAAHRRGWGSLYDALAMGHVDVAAQRRVLSRHAAPGEQPVYAIDLSVWPRCDAEANPERGYYHHPSRHSAGQPILAGCAYQWLAQLTFTRDSWTAPLDTTGPTIGEPSRYRLGPPPRRPLLLRRLDASQSAKTVRSLTRPSYR
jgi:hypothetical protein